MYSAELWTNAWTAALPAWQAAVRLSGWHPVVAAVAHASVALLCVAAGQSARAGGAPGPFWPIVGGALLLLAVNTLFAFELLSIEVLRSVARTSGWYAARRDVQAVALVAIGTAAMAALAVWTLMRHPRAATAPGTQRSLASFAGLAGLALLAGLATLRMVSLHATDELINSRLAGLSLGRLIEALGLGLLAARAWSELRAASP